MSILSSPTDPNRLLCLRWKATSSTTSVWPRNVRSAPRVGPDEDDDDEEEEELAAPAEEELEEPEAEYSA
jgi:hypothetical protein